MHQHHLDADIRLGELGEMSVEIEFLDPPLRRCDLIERAAVGTDQGGGAGSELKIRSAVFAGKLALAGGHFRLALDWASPRRISRKPWPMESNVACL